MAQKKQSPAENKLLPPAAIPDPAGDHMNTYLWGTALEGKVSNLSGLQRAIDAQVRLLAEAIKKLSQQVGPPGGGTGTGPGGSPGGGITPANILVGTHATRLAVYTPPISGVGSVFYETDRHVLYVVVLSPPIEWVFAAGIYLAPLADQPSDLGTADTGFMFLDTDDDQLFVWDGSTWIEITVDVEAAGYWAPITNGDPENPEFIFDSDGDCVVGWVPTP